MAPTPLAGSSPASRPETLSQALTQKIRELLKARRWSQREFAEQLGVTQGAVSYLLAEKRRAEVLDYYERLAQVFGVPLSVLVYDLEQRVKGTQTSAGGAPAVPTPPGSRASAEFDRTATLVESTLVRAFIEALFHVRSHAPAAPLDTRVHTALTDLHAHLSAAVHEGPPPVAPRRRRAAAAPFAVPS